MMGLFNEDEMVLEFEKVVEQTATRERLVSEDIFKEIDEQFNVPEKRLEPTKEEDESSSDADEDEVEDQMEDEDSNELRLKDFSDK
jgi:hypothetical protein